MYEGRKSYSLLYSVGLAACASLLTLLGVVLIGPVVGQNERWLGIGYLWLLSHPAILVFALVGGFTYRLYREQIELVKLGGIFTLTAALVGTISMVTTWIGGLLLGGSHG